MTELNSLANVLELARSTTPETVGEAVKLIYPAIVELGLTEVEAGQVLATLKASTGATLTALRNDLGTHLQVNNLTAEKESVGTRTRRTPPAENESDPALLDVPLLPRTRERPLRSGCAGSARNARGEGRL